MNYKRENVTYLDGVKKSSIFSLPLGHNSWGLLPLIYLFCSCLIVDQELHKLIIVDCSLSWLLIILEKQRNILAFRWTLDVHHLGDSSLAQDHLLGVDTCGEDTFGSSFIFIKGSTHASKVVNFYKHPMVVIYKFLVTSCDSTSWVCMTCLSHKII
jgi:hypothetical protein